MTTTHAHTLSARFGRWLVLIVLALALGVTMSCAKQAADPLAISSAAAPAPLRDLDFGSPVHRIFSADPWFVACLEDGMAVFVDPASPERPGAGVDLGARCSGFAWIASERVGLFATDDGRAVAVAARTPSGAETVGELGPDVLRAGAIDAHIEGDVAWIRTASALEAIVLDRDAAREVIGLHMGATTRLFPGTVGASASGGLVYLAASDGTITAHAPRADGSLEPIAQKNVGRGLTGIVSRARDVMALTDREGLVVVRFDGSQSARLVHYEATLAAASTPSIAGALMTFGLADGAVVVVDASSSSTMRAIASVRGDASRGAAIAGGDLVLASASHAKTYELPTVVTAFSPDPRAAPVYAGSRLTVRFSKPLDMASAQSNALRIRCGDRDAPRTVVRLADPRTLWLTPLQPLPADAECDLFVMGLTDWRGHPVGRGRLGDVVHFRTSAAAISGEPRPASVNAHAVDGRFSQIGESTEWSDIRSARGVLADFYADYDGGALWLLVDAVGADAAVDSACVERFFVITGSGAERVEVRVYPDGEIDVLRNGLRIEDATKRYSAAFGFGPSPASERPHAIWELRVPATPGQWAIDTWHADPLGGCASPLPGAFALRGELTGGGQSGLTLLPETNVDPPAPVNLVEPANNATAVRAGDALAWAMLDPTSALTLHAVDISTDITFTHGVYSALVFGSTLTIPRGLLPNAAPTYWRVRSVNASGSKDSQVYQFLPVPRVGRNEALVEIVRDGDGTVQSDPRGLDCGQTCVAAFQRGSLVKLDAIPTDRSIFSHWEGDCAALGPREGALDTRRIALSVDGAKQCTAIFRSLDSVKRNLTVSVAPQAGGSVLSVPPGIGCPGTSCSDGFASGAVVTLTASPRAGYEFDSWAGDCADAMSNAQAIVTMDSDKSCVANFRPIMRSVNVQVSPASSGRVDEQGAASPQISNCGLGGSCQGAYPNFSTLTLLAIPSPGYAFRRYTGCADTMANPIALPIGAPLACTAEFGRKLDVTTTPGGAVSGMGIQCGQDCSEVYAGEPTITLTATADAGFAFSGWSGNCSGQTPTFDVPMTGPRACSAAFVAGNDLQVSVTRNDGSSGSVTSAPAGIQCADGCSIASATYVPMTAVTLTATPAAGTEFAGWGGDCVAAGTNLQANVTLDVAKSCSATFNRIPVTITVANSPMAGGTVVSFDSKISCGATCAADYLPGSNVQLAAVPAAMCTFVSWSGCSMSTNTSLLLTNVQASTTCTAIYTCP